MYNLFTVNVNHFVKMCEFCLSLIPRRGMVPPFPFSCSTHTQTHTLSVGRCGDKQEADHSSPDCLIISATTRHPGLVTHPAVIQPLWGSHTSPRTPQHTPSAWLGLTLPAPPLPGFLAACSWAGGDESLCFSLSHISRAFQSHPQKNKGYFLTLLQLGC